VVEQSPLADAGQVMEDQPEAQPEPSLEEVEATTADIAAPEQIDQDSAAAEVQAEAITETAEIGDAQPEVIEEPTAIEEPEVIEEPEITEQLENVEEPEHYQEPDEIQEPMEAEEPEDVEKLEGAEEPEDLEDAEDVEESLEQDETMPEAPVDTESSNITGVPSTPRHPALTLQTPEAALRTPVASFTPVNAPSASPWVGSSIEESPAVPSPMKSASRVPNTPIKVFSPATTTAPGSIKSIAATPAKSSIIEDAKHFAQLSPATSRILAGDAQSPLKHSSPAASPLGIHSSPLGLYSMALPPSPLKRSYDEFLADNDDQEEVQVQKQDEIQYEEQDEVELPGPRNEAAVDADTPMTGQTDPLTIASSDRKGKAKFGMDLSSPARSTRQDALFHDEASTIGIHGMALPSSPIKDTPKAKSSSPVKSSVTRTGPRPSGFDSLFDDTFSLSPVKLPAGQILPDSEDEAEKEPEEAVESQEQEVPAHETQTTEEATQETNQTGTLPVQESFVETELDVEEATQETNQTGTLPVQESFVETELDVEEATQETNQTDTSPVQESLVETEPEVEDVAEPARERESSPVKEAPPASAVKPLIYQSSPATNASPSKRPVGFDSLFDDSYSLTPVRIPAPATQRAQSPEPFLDMVEDTVNTEVDTQGTASTEILEESQAKADSVSPQKVPLLHTFNAMLPESATTTPIKQSAKKPLLPGPSARKHVQSSPIKHTPKLATAALAMTEASSPIPSSPATVLPVSSFGDGPMSSPTKHISSEKAEAAVESSFNESGFSLSPVKLTPLKKSIGTPATTSKNVAPSPSPVKQAPLLQSSPIASFVDDDGTGGFSMEFSAIAPPGATTPKGRKLGPVKSTPLRRSSGIFSDDGTPSIPMSAGSSPGRPLGGSSGIALRQMGMQSSPVKRPQQPFGGFASDIPSSPPVSAPIRFGQMLPDDDVEEKILSPVATEREVTPEQQLVVPELPSSPQKSLASPKKAAASPMKTFASPKKASASQKKAPASVKKAATPSPRKAFASPTKAGPSRFKVPTPDLRPAGSLDIMSSPSRRQRLASPFKEVAADVTGDSAAFSPIRLSPFKPAIERPQNPTPTKAAGDWELPVPSSSPPRMPGQEVAEQEAAEQDVAEDSWFLRSSSPFEDLLPFGSPQKLRSPKKATPRKRAGSPLKTEVPVLDQPEVEPEQPRAPPSAVKKSPKRRLSYIEVPQAGEDGPSTPPAKRLKENVEVAPDSITRKRYGRRVSTSLAQMANEPLFEELKTIAKGYLVRKMVANHEPIPEPVIESVSVSDDSESVGASDVERNEDSPEKTESEDVDEREEEQENEEKEEQEIQVVQQVAVVQETTLVQEVRKVQEVHGVTVENVITEQTEEKEEVMEQQIEVPTPKEQEEVMEQQVEISMPKEQEETNEQPSEQSKTSIIDAFLKKHDDKIKAKPIRSFLPAPVSRVSSISTSISTCLPILITLTITASQTWIFHRRSFLPASFSLFVTPRFWFFFSSSSPGDEEASEILRDYSSRNP
jgi:hypothetical protein